MRGSMRVFTMKPFMRRGVRVLVGAAAVAAVSAAPIMQLTGGYSPPPGSGGSTSVSIQASGTYNVSVLTTGGSTSSQTTIFSPPQACQNHAPNDATVGYYNSPQGALYQVDVAVCPVTTSQQEINKFLNTLNTHGWIHSVYQLRQVLQQFITVQTQQVCNAINYGGYFDARTEAHDSPYDHYWHIKYAPAASKYPWRPYAGGTAYKTFESFYNDPGGGAGSCAVRYSLLDQSPPVVEKVAINWQFQGSVSASLSAPPPIFNFWQPIGAFGNELNILASEAEQDAGYPQGSIDLQFPTWPTGTFADPKTVGGSLASVPWPVGVPLAVDPTGDPQTVSGSLDGQGPVIVTGTVTYSQSGIQNTVSLPPTTIGTWHISGNVTSNLVGYNVYSRDTLALVQSIQFCSMNQVNTSQAIFNGAPNAMNESYLGDNLVPLTYIDGSPLDPGNSNDLTLISHAACTIQYMNNPPDWPGAPYGDPPIHTSGVYGDPTGQATVTVDQTVGSIRVGQLNLPIHLPGTSCSVTINGSNGQSSGSWCRVATDLSGFTTPPSPPLYLHPAAFNAIAVPTGN
jgi:hypothetical protein